MAVAPQFTHSLASGKMDREEEGLRLSLTLSWTPPPPQPPCPFFGNLTTGGQGQGSTNLGGGIDRWIEGAPGGRKEVTGKVRAPIGTAGDRD